MGGTEVVREAHLDTGCSERLGVSDPVVADRVEVGGLDERRRQVLEVAEQGGDERVAALGDVRHVVVGEAVHRPLRQDRRVGVLDEGGGGHRHVRGRVDEALVPNGVQTVVPEALGDDGGEVAAGAVTAYRQAGGVGSDLVTVPDDPTRCVDAVVRGHWGGVVRRHPVVDRQDERVELVAEHGAQGVVVHDVAEHPATAVEVHDHRKRTPATLAVRPVRADRDLVPVAGRGGRVPDAHVRADVSEQAGQQSRARVDGRARLADVVLRHRPHGLASDLIHQCRDGSGAQGHAAECECHGHRLPS